MGGGQGRGEGAAPRSREVWLTQKDLGHTKAAVTQMRRIRTIHLHIVYRTIRISYVHIRPGAAIVLKVVLRKLCTVP